MPKPEATGSFKPVPTTEDWQAPLQGSVDIPITPELLADCQAGHLSFWVDVYPKRGNDNAAWYSLRFRRRDYRPKEAAAPAGADPLEELLPPIGGKSDGPDDEIPF